MQTTAALNCVNCGSPQLINNNGQQAEPGTLNGTSLTCQNCGTQFAPGFQGNTATVDVPVYSEPITNEVEVPKFIWDEKKQRKVINPKFDVKKDYERLAKENKNSAKPVAVFSSIIAVICFASGSPVAGGIFLALALLMLPFILRKPKY